MNREREDGKTLKEKIIEYLRRRIITNELKPGDRIVELDIAKKYNISRGPVREAVRILEKEGLLEYKKNIGCVVRVLTKKELKESHLLFNTLEKLSIQLVDGIIKDEYLKTIEKLTEDINQYVEEKDIEKIIQNDYEIHKQIILNAENEKLFELWNSMKSSNYAIYYTLINKNKDLINKAYKKHKDLIEILQEQNIDKSIKEIDKHYTEAHNLVYES